MRTGIGIVIGLILGFVIAYILFSFGLYNNLINSQNLQSSIKNAQNLQISTVNTCASQLNSSLSILQDKLPSGSKIQLINTTIFGNIRNSNVKNITLHQIAPGPLSHFIEDNLTISINNWVGFWESTYPEPKANCYNNFSFEVNPQYICQDLEILGVESENLSYINSTAAIGIAVKIQPNYSQSTIPQIYTILCNSNGNLLPNSKNFTENGADVVI